jgi:hypothetical protein
MMWAVGILLDAPLFDDDFGFTQRVENLPIETYGPSLYGPSLGARLSLDTENRLLTYIRPFAGVTLSRTPWP